MNTNVMGNVPSSWLLNRYKDHAISNITLQFYPDARHEILNETNRDEVQQDIQNWFEGQLP